MNQQSIPCRNRLNHAAGNSSGMILFAVAALLAALSMLAAGTYVFSRSDVLISGNALRAQQALYQAEAGVHYVRRSLESDLAAGNLSFVDGTATVSYSAPGGYSFDTVTNIVQLASNTNAYTYRVTGRSGNANTTLEVGVARTLLLDAGLMAMNSLDIAPNYDIYSYHSGINPNPMAPESSGEANVGSNVSIDVSPNSTIDGYVLLGVDENGVPAIYDGPSEIPTREAGHYEADPLGVSDGPLAARFDALPSDNDNTQAVPPITGNVIDLGPGDSVTLPAGDYYLTEIDMHPNSTLEVDTSEGPVNIFLSGPMYAGPNAQMNEGGRPPEFTIYSNSSEEIRLQPNNAFAGFVYAPFANVRIQPNTASLGAIWADTIELMPNGHFYIDTALMDNFLSTKVDFYSWKELRR